jgi:hypothetical protein
LRGLLRLLQCNSMDMHTTHHLTVMVTESWSEV